jgi:hypothetical protein
LTAVHLAAAFSLARSSREPVSWSISAGGYRCAWVR